MVITARGRFLFRKPLVMSYDMCESGDMERIIVKSDEARRRFRDLLTEAERGGVVEIRRYDTPTAIMVAPDWYEQAATLMAQHHAK